MVSAPRPIARACSTSDGAATCPLTRDRGCASCGQTLFVEAHHIKEHAHGGRTDLANGVLLCSRCHHRVHRKEWEIRIDTHGRVWFIPPPTIDPGGTPRPGVARQTLRERNRHHRDDSEPQD